MILCTITTNIIHTGLKTAKNIYVINEIYLAECVKLIASIGSAQDRSWEIPGPIPFAFKFVKIAVRKNGFLRDIDPVSSKKNFN